MESYYQDKHIALYNKDCKDMSELEDNSIDLSLGYKCLIIWESELGNPQAVIEKIRRWQNG